VVCNIKGHEGTNTDIFGPHNLRIGSQATLYSASNWIGLRWYGARTFQPVEQHKQPLSLSFTFLLSHLDLCTFFLDGTRDRVDLGPFRISRARSFSRRRWTSDNPLIKEETGNITIAHLRDEHRRYIKYSASVEKQRLERGGTGRTIMIAYRVEQFAGGHVQP